MSCFVAQNDRVLGTLREGTRKRLGLFRREADLQSLRKHERIVDHCAILAALHLDGKGSVCLWRPIAGRRCDRTAREASTSWVCSSTASGTIGTTAQNEKQGRFERDASIFRNWVTPDGTPGPSGEGGFKAERGRYHLYAAYFCPWAHRTLIMRKLKGLESAIDVSITHWLMLENGITFEPDDGVIEDPISNAKYLYEVYRAAKARLLRPRHRPGAVGQADEDHCLQRIRRHYSHDERELRWRRRERAGLLSEAISATRSMS